MKDVSISAQDGGGQDSGFNFHGFYKLCSSCTRICSWRTGLCDYLITGPLFLFSRCEFAAGPYFISKQVSTDGVDRGQARPHSHFAHILRGNYARNSIVNPLWIFHELCYVRVNTTPQLPTPKIVKLRPKSVKTATPTILHQY